MFCPDYHQPVLVSCYILTLYQPHLIIANVSVTINFNKKWSFYYYSFLLTILNLMPFYCVILVLMYRYLIRISLCLSHALKNPAK